MNKKLRVEHNYEVEAKIQDLVEKIEETKKNYDQIKLTSTQTQDSIKDLKEISGNQFQKLCSYIVSNLSKGKSSTKKEEEKKDDGRKANNQDKKRKGIAFSTIY